VSSLWTPGGERPVPPRDQGANAAGDADTDSDIDDELDPLSEAGIDREQAEALAREMAEVRRQLAEVPAAQVVANHAMGLFELAAIHLNQPSPNLVESALAIDGMAALVEGLGGRLGEAESPLRDALAQIRLAFVEIRSRHQAAE